MPSQFSAEGLTTVPSSAASSDALERAASEMVNEALLRTRARGACAVVAAHGAGHSFFDLEIGLENGRVGESA